MGSRACFVTRGSPYWVSCESWLRHPGLRGGSSDFETCLQILVLADQLMAGLEGDGLEQRCEVLGEIGLGIGTQTSRAEMRLNCLPRRRRDRKRDAEFAAKLQAEIDILAQQRSGEGRGPVEIHQGRGLVPGEYRAQDRIVQEFEEGVPRNARTLR